MPSEVDALIVEPVEQDRQATEEELARIVAHVAEAPFSSRPVRVPRRIRERLAQAACSPVASRLPSLELHLLERVHADKQWPVGTTAARYLDDLHRAVQHLAAQIWTYRYRGDPFIAFLAPSHVTGGRWPEPFLFVAYNARFGCIITGFQTKGVGEIFHGAFEKLRRQR